MSMHPVALPAPIELKGEGEDDASAIVTKALDELMATVDDRLKAVETKAADAAKLTTRLDDLEKKLARPAIGTKSAGGTEADEVKAAFANYLRTGRADEIKALTVEAPGTGDVIAPPQVSSTIIQKIAEFSPVRQLASSIGLSAPLLQIPRMVNEVTVGEVTETSARPESDPTFEQIDLKPHEMAVIVPMSQTIIEDAAVDIVSFVSTHIAMRFGVKEAAWFVTGNGATQAEGVLTSTEVAAFESANTAIKADDLIDTFYAIKSVYASRGSWLMNRTTMAAVRKLKDSSGVYLWQPALSANVPPTLLGRPVYETPDAPNPVAGATPIVFGDLASGYLIGDRIALALKYDDLTGSDNGIVKIRARRRVGGRVVLGEALTKLKLAA